MYLGQSTTFGVHDHSPVLHFRRFSRKASHMVMLHQFGDQEVWPNIEVAARLSVFGILLFYFLLLYPLPRNFQV
jgi:hypothetical protein